MNIVLFGEDIFTAVVLQSLVSAGHQISAVVCPFYGENREYQSLNKVADNNHISFLRMEDVNSDELGIRLTHIAPDLIISVHLKKILSPSIYSIATRGAINVHPSLLPKYRGLSPQHQVLLKGERKTGVTVHFISEKPDTGDIILQEEIVLQGNTTIYELQIQMLAIYKHLVTQAVRQIEMNQFIRISQDETKASWYGPLKRSDREIDFEKAKSEIYNLIRSVSKPYKGAFYKNVTVWSAFFSDNSTEKNLMTVYPETGIYFFEDKLILRLKDGILLSNDFEHNEF